MYNSQRLKLGQKITNEQKMQLFNELLYTLTTDYELCRWSNQQIGEWAQDNIVFEANYFHQWLPSRRSELGEFDVEYHSATFTNKHCFITMAKEELIYAFHGGFEANLEYGYFSRIMPLLESKSEHQAKLMLDAYYDKPTYERWIEYIDYGVEDDLEDANALHAKAKKLFDSRRITVQVDLQEELKQKTYSHD